MLNLLSTNSDKCLLQNFSKRHNLLDKCPKNLLNLFYRTPGEPRIANKEVLNNGIIEGVKSGIFGIGELDNTQIKCIYFKENPVIEFEENEILIREDLCKKEMVIETVVKAVVEEPVEIFTDEQKSDDEVVEPNKSLLEQISLSFKIPKGRVHDVFQMLNFIQKKFANIEISIKASEGSITKQDYEDKILETLRQIGVEVK